MQSLLSPNLERSNCGGGESGWRHQLRARAHVRNRQSRTRAYTHNHSGHIPAPHGVHDDLGKHLGEEVFEELGGHNHLCPVVAGFQDVEYITCRSDKRI